MTEQSHEIEYCIRFGTHGAGDGKETARNGKENRNRKTELRYRLRVDAAGPAPLPSDNVTGLPAWTRLDFHQCPNCPLNSKNVPTCPAAAAISPIVADCENIPSDEKLELEVRSGERLVSVETDAQKALGSLLGLYLANSGCPRLDFFRPMAYFHLPLATPEETMFRALASFFMANYFQGRAASGFDLSPLNVLYEQVQIVNAHLVLRVKEGCRSDALPNAVVQLHLLSCILPESLDQALHELRPLFRGLMKIR